MEHRTDWTDDLFPRVGRQHARAARFAGEVREQDSNPYQDRPQLENALEIPARRVLHTEGVGRIRNVVDGSRAHPPKRLEMVQAN